jgi:hypothetical protein
LSTADPSACDACTQLQGKYCTFAVQVLFDAEVCPSAPFTASMSKCMRTASEQCAYETKTQTACLACLVGNERMLQQAGCTVDGIGVLRQVCQTINGFAAPEWRGTLHSQLHS